MAKLTKYWFDGNAGVETGEVQDGVEGARNLVLTWLDDDGETWTFTIINPSTIHM